MFCILISINIINVYDLLLKIIYIYKSFKKNDKFFTKNINYSYI